MPYFSRSRTHSDSDSASLRPVSFLSAAASSVTAAPTAAPAALLHGPEVGSVRYVAVSAESRYIPVTITTGRLSTQYWIFFKYALRY